MKLSEYEDIHTCFKVIGESLNMASKYELSR